MSGTPSILAIDQGTTGTTCLVLSEDGRVLGRAYSEFTQYLPQPGWVEQDAREVWEVTQGGAPEALGWAGGAAGGGFGGMASRSGTWGWPVWGLLSHAASVSYPSRSGQMPENCTGRAVSCAAPRPAASFPPQGR